MKLSRFCVEDIDGCEFVKSRSVGHMLISFDRDFDEFLTGKIRVVYADGSHKSISPEEAQTELDTGEWTVMRF